MARNGTPLWSELIQLSHAVGTAMAVTLRNLFRKPVTIHYPDVKR